MEKTAMQEAFDKIQESIQQEINVIENKNVYSQRRIYESALVIQAVNNALKIINSLKEKEKQQIIDAAEKGNDYDNPIVIDGEQYYNEKFKQ